MIIDFKLLDKCNNNDIPLFALPRHTNPAYSIEDFANSGVEGYARYHFVIPLKTRYSCKKCGKCCHGLLSIGDKVIDGNPCPDLLNNSCNIYSNRYTSCRTYPYHIVTQDGKSDILLIDSECAGYGTGIMITHDSYKRIVRYLNRLYVTSDGIQIKYANPTILGNSTPA